MIRNIAVFGLGYVGLTTAACFAESGHKVIGVDIDAQKVRLVASGQSPISEPGIGELIAKHLKTGSLLATTSVHEAVQATEIALLCVGTPTGTNGLPDLTALTYVTRQLEAAIAQHGKPYQIVVRSTVPPGTTANVLHPILQGLERPHSSDIRLLVNPEFLREGSAMRDFFNPPKIVIGAANVSWAREGLDLYAGISAKKYAVDLATAEFVKYMDNPWHALKIAFANEIGTIAARHSVSVSTLFDIFTSDEKLNISAKYLAPGFSFGGSCLPKDLRALEALARQEGVSAPLISSVIPSNDEHLARALARVHATGKSKIGLIGLAFKYGTDDLRESPAVELARRLIGHGYELRIFDQYVEPSKLIGRNRTFIERSISNLARLMLPSIEEIAEWSEAIVITAAGIGIGPFETTKPVVSLVRVEDERFDGGTTS